ncbi:MAG: pyruvate kinase, partial [Cyclobacteriaceae bacterium]
MKKEILFNKTKIIATVGPSCDTKEKLEELIHAGVDVFRLNFSHGTHEKHQKVIDLIHAINMEHHTNTCILQDLQGPKIRTGEVENEGVEIHSGDNLVITTKELVGNSQRVSTSYTSLASDVEIGDGILIDDGKIELLVEDYDESDVICRVVHGGILKSRKGINLPHTNVSAPSLTDKDIADLELGIANDVEWIALSFVRSAADVLHIKERIHTAGKNIKVIAKIEKPEAVKDIDAIIEA